LTITPARAEKRLSSGANNFGVITDARSGLLALDIDPKNSGPASLAALELEHDVLPLTRLHR